MVPLVIILDSNAFRIMPLRLLITDDIFRDDDDDDDDNNDDDDDDDETGWGVTRVSATALPHGGSLEGMLVAVETAAVIS